MTWFKVDDSFHSHPKVYAASPAALGLWVVAGSWSGANLSDGFIPDHVLPRLLPDSASLAKELVAAGLWKRTRGGYRFHDWNDFNPLGSDIQKEREAARERMRRLRSGRKGESRDLPVTSAQSNVDQKTRGGKNQIDPRSSDGTPGHPSNGSPEHVANVRDMFVTPTRPVPKGRGGTGDLLGARSETRARSEPPSPRCEQHIDVDDPPPCGSCADARRARARWEVAESERRRTQPQCRLHRGQPAHNCGPCRADALVNREIS